MRQLKIFLASLLCFFWASAALAQQGQWGGFVYLTPQSGKEMTAEQKAAAMQVLTEASADFSNDFTPEKGKTDTIQFVKAVSWTLNGAPLAERAPSALIRVEAMDRQKIDRFAKAVYSALVNYYDLDYRVAVTLHLNYTDAPTLEKLKTMAPKRGNGTDQPYAVVLPMSKTAQWWGLTAEKREQYFNAHPAAFGKDHLGHNGVGFMYIDRIFRKLYHSRFVDSQQDFITYFEFAEEHKETFNQLMNGLRDTKVNPEWQFVQEKPLLLGKRVRAVADMF